MITRHINKLIQYSLQHFPAVILLGPRQIGKSTLAQQLIQQGYLGNYLTLDDIATLTVATQDPDGFLAQFSGNIIIDEVQRAPDILRALKKQIDQNRTPGRFLLTGSSNLLLYPNVKESLAGRVDIIYLTGLSLAELQQAPQPSPFLQELFLHSNTFEYVQGLKQYNEPPHLSRIELLKNIFYGGFPEVALSADNRFSQRWFAAYQTTYVEKDIRDIARLINIIDFNRLLKFAGLKTGQLLNISNLANDLGIDQRTCQRYIDLLTITLQFSILPSWHRNIGKRLVKTPKLVCMDSGLACYLSGVESPEHLIAHPMIGALLETWVHSQLRAQLALLTNIELSFYRTHAHREVDFILEKGNKLVAIKVKLANKIGNKDFIGLQDFLTATPQASFGILLYSGEQIIVLNEKLLALPIHWLGANHPQA